VKSTSFHLNSAFLLIFFTTTSFTLLSGGCSVWLSNNENLSPQQTRVFETCNTTWNMGIGAIFGLLSSRALAPTESETEEESE
jgi:hypothetical protein